MCYFICYVTLSLSISIEVLSQFREIMAARLRYLCSNLGSKSKESIHQVIISKLFRQGHGGARVHLRQSVGREAGYILHRSQVCCRGKSLQNDKCLSELQIQKKPLKYSTCYLWFRSKPDTRKKKSLVINERNVISSL